MRGFLEPRNGPRGILSKLEATCFASAAVCLAATLALAGPAPALSGLSANAGIALLSVGLGSVARGLRWRRALSRHAIDPNATVFYERGDYARIIERVDEADQVDLLGISLLYALEYIKDHHTEYVRRVRHTRILLPGTQEICDGRDIAQGTEAGGLWASAQHSEKLVHRLMNEHPNSFSLRFFTAQPYLAMTRVGQYVWVSPYLTMSGRSCPVIAVEKATSPELYTTFTTHFERIWQRSSPDRAG